MAYVNTRERPSESEVIWVRDIDISVNAEYPVMDVSQLEPAWGSDAENRVLVLEQFIILYKEATDTTNSDNIRFGSLSVQSKYHDFSTPSGKSIGDVDTVSQSQMSTSRMFTTDVWLQIETVSGSGTGVVDIGIKFTYDYTKYIGFSRTL